MGMRRFFRGVVYGVCVVVVFVSTLWLATIGWGDAALYPPVAGTATVEVALADHGVHAGLIIGMDDLDRMSLELKDPVLIALHTRFAAYRFLEIGWGDEQFYRFAPALSDVSVGMAFNALSGWNGKSVLHVVGLDQDAKATFKHSDVQVIRLSKEGFRKLIKGISGTFAADPYAQPMELGKGLYGPSLFYRAAGHYSVIRTCNVWLGGLLASAGMKVSPVPSVTSMGLLTEIRWRNAL
ncbi:MAG: hypothetical protein JWM58_2101 [Rhizobium sp.]|nr:hypothetical protein [Rhizobium sp.]